MNDGRNCYLCLDTISKIVSELDARYLVGFSSLQEMSDAIAEAAKAAGRVAPENIFSVQKLKGQPANPALESVLRAILR